MESPSPPEARIHRRYRAFISYSHRDARWAAWLHRRLESYRVPRRLRGGQGEFGPVPERLHPIFRDREELASSSVLGDRLHEALADSEALIVVCSPAAARSRWVDAEIDRFLALGRGDRIHCVIVDGEPNAGDERECFPPSLRSASVAEPMAADLRSGADGRRLVLLKLIAGMIGIPLDSLRNREAQRHHRRMLGAVAASLSGMIVALGLATAAWIARNDAQRRQAQAQDLIVYMLGNLHDRLEKVGRLDLLDSLGDKAIDYLTHLNPRDLNDTTLKQLAKAETQLGQVRLDQGRHAAALRSFRVAYERTRALARRHPGDATLLFDRGQAEFWIGYVYWQSRQMDRARAWFTRYRDTSRAAYATDPTRSDWRHELASGDHNLAAVELEMGRLREAAQGFAASYGIFVQMLARDPGNTQLRFEVADEISWRGSVEEHSGNLDGAEKDMARKAGMLAGIVARHPNDPSWKLLWSTAQLQQVSLQLVLGRYARAQAVADATVRRMKALVSHDPGNKDWSQAYLHALILRAAARMGSGDAEQARADLALAGPVIRASRKFEARNRLVRRHLQYASQLELVLALRAGDLVSAREASSRLMAGPTGADAPQLPEDIGRQAWNEILAGRVDQADGRPADAAAHYQAALTLLRPRIGGSTYWRILDPWVRACVLTGQADAARHARALLDRARYVPLWPWPKAASVSHRVRTGSSFQPPRMPAHVGEAPRSSRRPDSLPLARAAGNMDRS